MGPRKKQPWLGSLPPKEQPRAANNPADVNKRHPVWRLKHADLEGPYGWKNACQADLLRIFARLRDLESMTWGEIEKGKSNGFMDASAICKEAQDRLREIKRDTQDTLFKLRVTQSGRLWGVRWEHVFDFLWWDPDHKVYPMNIADN